MGLNNYVIARVTNKQFVAGKQYPIMGFVSGQPAVFAMNAKGNTVMVSFMDTDFTIVLNARSDDKYSIK